MLEQDQPNIITPREFVERTHLQVQYEIARLEAEFMEKTRNADQFEFLDLIENHCLSRFDVWALHAVPLAQSPTCLGVHPYYEEILRLVKERILSELSTFTRSMHVDWQEEMKLRVVPRLAARCKSWWAVVGIALLDANSGSCRVQADRPSTTGQSGEVAPVEVSAATAVMDAGGDGTQGLRATFEGLSTEFANSRSPLGHWANQSKKRGPKPNYDILARVGEIVRQVAPDGFWRPKFDEICDALDRAEVPCPPVWRSRYKAGRWSDYPEKWTAIKAIEGRLGHPKRKPHPRNETIS